MTYSQLAYRLAATAIAIYATYLLATDRMCFPPRIGACRPAHGLVAVALFLSAISLSAFLFIAATQPRRGARARGLLVACLALFVLFFGAFLADLFHL